MPLTITTLIENEADENKELANQHGLSFLIEKEDHSLLFDTGKTGAFIENAEKLGKDLSALEAVAISHAHYDHAGGFRSLAEFHRDFKLYLGQGFFMKKFGVSRDELKYLGSNFDEDYLKALGINYTFISKAVTEILPGIHILSTYPRIYKDEGLNPRFRLADGEGWVQDMFTDEICLAIETSGGMVVVLGCSHPGMRNMLDAVKERFSKPIRAVIGGTHLVAVEGDALERSLNYLKDESLELVAVSHCTGKEAVKVLERNKNFQHNHSGGVFRFV